MRILPFTDELAPDFHAINAAWIADMFVLEPHDEHVLANPRAAIVDRGGVILFVADDAGRVLGTGALMPTGLARPGIGTLYLLTSSKCAAAIHLYEKAGFVHDAAIMAAYGATYERCDVAMRFPLVPAGAAA